MRAFHTLIATLAVSCAVGCGWLRPAARTALDVLEQACIVAHAADAPEEVARACGIAEELLPLVRDLIAARRLAATHEACK